jgi:hypothetical protein
MVLVLTACGRTSTEDGLSSPTQQIPGSTEEQVPCLTDPNPHAIYSGEPTGIAIVGDRVLLTSTEIVSVPLAGGDPTTIAQPDHPFGLLVAGGMAYFATMYPYALWSVPTTGGDPVWLMDSPPFMSSAAADATSLYFESNAGELVKMTPPATTFTALPLGGTVSVGSIAPYGDYVYVAGDDIGSSAAYDGVIERVPKTGGVAQRIVSGIALPGNLVVDASGLYWTEGYSSAFGAGRVAHAALDGSGVTTVLYYDAQSLAVSGGNLFFASGTIGMIPESGGGVTTIASGHWPGMLRVLGSNLVWGDPVNGAMSDPTPTLVMAACVPGG